MKKLKLKITVRNYHLQIMNSNLKHLVAKYNLNNKNKVKIMIGIHNQDRLRVSRILEII
jgi:hypothetical protein